MIVSRNDRYRVRIAPDEIPRDVYCVVLEEVAYEGFMVDEKLEAIPPIFEQDELWLPKKIRQGIDGYDNAVATARDMFARAIDR